MNYHIEYFKQHDEIKERIIEICQLFHRHDPRMYPDIAMDDILFYYNNDGRFCVINYGMFELNLYCIIEVKYLSWSNDLIANEIVSRMKERDERDKRYYGEKSNNKKVKSKK
jgi:hypothetical protein